MQKSLQKSPNDRFNQPGPLIVIVGQTASGKSSLAMKIAAEYDGEIICADSRTMYRGMDIGTAKPSISDQKAVPHHLLDIVNPSERISAHKFVQLAQKTMNDIWVKDKLPIVVGGSGMYIDALVFGYSFKRKPGEATDKSLTPASLVDLQQRVRDRYGSDVSDDDYKNERRLRAILDRGIVSTSDRFALNYECICIGLQVDDIELKQRIEARTSQMFALGFVEEVIGLQARYGESAPGLQATGYREVVRGLSMGLDVLEIQTSVNRATWQLARKQRTWFKRNTYIHWVKGEASAQREVAIYMGQSEIQ